MLAPSATAISRVYTVDAKFGGRIFWYIFVSFCQNIISPSVYIDITQSFVKMLSA